jgi:hypothetical protein
MQKGNRQFAYARALAVRRQRLCRRHANQSAIGAVQGRLLALSLASHSPLPKKISGVKASLMHSHHLFAYINYRALFNPAPVFTTFNAVHGHLRDAKFFR